MASVSFIKIVFMHPFLLYQSCVQIPGADCITNGWTNANRVIECAGKLYIGDFTGGQKVYKTFPCQPERKIIFSFTIAKFDSWDLESVFVYKDGQLIGQITYAPFQGVQMCADTTFPDLTEEKSFYFVQPIEQNSFTLLLEDNLQAYDVESWGFRGIKLQVLNPCVDFYSECNFFGDLWRVCAGNQTLFSKFVPFKIKSINILQGIIVQMKDPQFQGGNLQTYTSNQTCLDDFHVIQDQQTVQSFQSIKNQFENFLISEYITITHIKKRNFLYSKITVKYFEKFQPRIYYTQSEFTRFQ